MPKPISTIGGANDATQSSIRSTQKPETVASTDGHNVYVMPIVHVTLPESAVNAGFWAVLVGAGSSWRDRSASGRAHRYRCTHRETPPLMLSLPDALVRRVDASNQRGMMRNGLPGCPKS